MQLAYEADGDDFLVVASAMGADRHPAWRHNLEAADTATVRTRAGVVEVTPTLLSDAEKETLWPRLSRTIPQMNTYRQRTDRNIRVFRLSPR